MDNVIIGYSGHACVVIESALKIGVKFDFYCDKNKNEANPFSLQFAGLESEDIIKDRNWFVGIGDISIRKGVFQKFKEFGNCITIKDTSAVISNTAQIKKGTFIAPNATVNALALIGECVIINTSAIVEHECIINDFAHVAPGAVLAGNVTIGESSFIGANSIIKEGLNIGKNTVIGAGAVVLNDIPDNSVVVGNPGTIIKKTNS